MNESKKSRERGNYNRALKMCIEAARNVPPDHPDAALSWPEYRALHMPRFLAVAAKDSKGRGRKPGEAQTERQKYQATYQKARREAQQVYMKSDVLQEKYDEFPLYWQAHKNSYLPQGFLTYTAGGLVARRPKRSAFSKDVSQRALYRSVHAYHRRRWEANDMDEYARFGTWETYWEFVKAQGFVPKGGDEPIKDLVAHEEIVDENHEPAPVFHRIPDGWLGRNKVETPVVEPAQAATPMEAVHDTEDTEDNDGWITLA